MFWQKDLNGFAYPQVDRTKCINCNCCEKVCSYSDGGRSATFCESFAAVATDIDLNRTASGGIFSSLAYSVLKTGGVVFGCSMLRESGTLIAKHVAIQTEAELYLLAGSKYVQSNLENSFAEAKEFLNNGRMVLFSGTPCQISGLYGYLGKDYANLYTIELICHGTPSPDFFQSYIAYVEQKNNIEVLNFKFRNKSDGWKLYGSIRYQTEDKSEQIKTFEPEESSYYQLFLDSFTYRENCYSCPFAGKNRQADITIGDYWCIELVHPELEKEIDIHKGVSCIVINNHKGKAFLENFGRNIKRWQSSYEKAATYNKQLLIPSQLTSERETVLALYAEHGYEAVEEWYRKRLRIKKFKRKIKAMIPKKMKSIVRKIVKIHAQRTWISDTH